MILQLIYFRIYANSAGLKALGVDAATPDPQGGKIEKDANAEPNGIMNGAGAVRAMLAKLGEVAAQQMIENVRLLMADLNRVGITAYQEFGGRAFSPHHIEPFKVLADRKQMTVRTFYNLWQEPSSPAEVDKAVETIRQMKPFQGDEWFDSTGYGEAVYFPLHDNLLMARANPSPDNMKLWRRIAQVVADRGMHLNVHAQLRGSIEAFLSEIEDINRMTPIKGLRWAISHADQIELQDIERLKRLNIAIQFAAEHSRRSDAQSARRAHGHHAAASYGAG